MASRLKKRYLVTAAQNGCELDEGFWGSIQSYLKYHPDTELLVLPISYRKSAETDWYDDRIEPYLCTESFLLNDHLMVIAHQHSLPTSSNPIPGAVKSLPTHKSTIIGGNQIGFETVATPHHKLPKILASTGVVTERNYSETASGARAGIWHTFGALIVEIDGDIFHIRQIEAEETTGEFYDLNWHYRPYQRRKKSTVSAIVTGDTHAQWTDPRVVASTYFNKNSLINTLKPKYLVWHDLLDFYSRNHHHHKNDLINYAKHHGGLTNVEAEIKLTLDLVDQTTKPGVTNVIVPSNHNEALDRWLREADPKVDPENAAFYHRMKSLQYENTQITSTGLKTIDPFAEYAKNYMQSWDQTEFLSRDQSFLINGIEVGFHGDQGPNGGRGSVRNFSRIGVKTIIGHSHSPGIVGSCYQVGTSSLLKLEYNKGPSSWLNTHCIIYPNGKRSLLSVIEGEWRVQLKSDK